MGINVSTLTTGPIKNILGVSQRTVAKLIDSTKLKGDRLPGTKGRRVNLADLIKFMSEHNFPRARLLSFIEDYGATEEELGRYNFTEPIGTGNIWFYPEIPHYPDKPDIFKVGDVAKLFNCAPLTARGFFDRKNLNHYRIPQGSFDGRTTVDDLVRFYTHYNMSIPQELEGKSSLLISYPGGWKKSQKLVYVPDIDTSVWYRDNKNVQEVSIRCENDGLYVKLIEGICNLILLGMTGREEPNMIVYHDCIQHIQQIEFYLTKGFSSLANAGGSKKAQKTKGVLEYAMSQFDAYLTGKS